MLVLSTATVLSVHYIMVEGREILSRISLLTSHAAWLPWFLRGLVYDRSSCNSRLGDFHVAKPNGRFWRWGQVGQRRVPIIMVLQVNNLSFGVHYFAESRRSWLWRVWNVVIVVLPQIFVGWILECILKFFCWTILVENIDALPQSIILYLQQNMNIKKTGLCIVIYIIITHSSSSVLGIPFII